LSPGPRPQKTRCSTRAAHRRTRGETQRMPRSSGSLMPRAAGAARIAVVVLTWLVSIGVIGSRPAAAQPPGPQPLPATPQIFDFLSNYDFQLTGIALGIDDRRFSWDTHVGGALDVIGYPKGRGSIVADYEAVLGNELRAFDPNQAVYTLETSGSFFV